MRKLTLFIILVLAAATLPSCMLAGRDRRSEQRMMETEVGQPTYFVDYAGFKMDAPNVSRLEVYYQVYNFGLQFQREGDAYVAEYVFTARIMDGGEQVETLEQNRRVTVDNYEATLSRFDFRTSQFSFELPPGKYTLETTLRDQNSNQIRNREFPLTLDDFKADQPLSSDLLFTYAVEPASDASGTFTKGNLTVVPSVTRLYGGEDSARLLYYFEIYSGNDNKVQQVNVETILRSPSRGMIYRDTLYVDLGDAVVRQLRDISLAEYSPGDYELEVNLLGRRNKRLASQREAFTIQWSQEALLKHDFDKAVQQLGYIASQGAIDDLKKPETLEERVDAFNSFWKERDPTPGTRENEAKREFYRRITYADRQFGHLRREGWRTDRGRIYIQYGEPDQIDDFPISPQYAPYQIWHYYRDGRYRRFTFLDQNEDGDYRLQFPYDGLNQRPDF